MTFLSFSLSHGDLFLNFSYQNSPLEKYRWQSAGLEKLRGGGPSGKIRGGGVALLCTPPYFDHWLYCIVAQVMVAIAVKVNALLHSNNEFRCYYRTQWQAAILSHQVHIYIRSFEGLVLRY